MPVKLIKDFLPVLFNEVPAWKIKLLSLWPTIMGQISDNVILESIQDSTIVVVVKSSAWLHEINCLKFIIIEKINRALAGNYVTHMRLKNKSIILKKNTEYIKRKKNTFANALTLSHAQEVALCNIHDTELQVLLKKFLMRCMSQTH